MNNKDLKLKKIFFSAVENQQKGNFEIAENLYKKILDEQPNHLVVMNNLGALLIQGGKKEKAEIILQKVLKIDSNNINALENLGIIFKESIKYQKAIECHKKVIKLNPNHAGAHNNIGLNYRHIGEFDLAKVHFDKANEINPNNPDVYNSLGILMTMIKKHDKAISAYKKALELQPNFYIAQANLSNAYITKLDNFEKAIEESYKTVSLRHKILNINNQRIQLYRLKHDVEQADYLKSKNYKINGLEEFSKNGKEILNRIKNKSNNEILLSDNEIKSLTPFLKADHIYHAPNLSKGVLNPNKNWSEVEKEYLKSPKQIIYIDNFLSEKAIKEIREFCLTSKVWMQQYVGKYLGAFSESGFISPMHLQIGTELQKKLPNLFGKYNIGKFWAFKYDTTLGTGIGIHADFANLNLNFWITPDKYNNEKNSGGLKVYDVPAPENWSFKRYNNNSEEIYNFLKEKKANCVTIPYKYNRAVLFNSAYFHETDKINFKEGYESRRINITYLFGSRQIKKTIS